MREREEGREQRRERCIPPLVASTDTVEFVATGEISPVTCSRSVPAFMRSSNARQTGLRVPVTVIIPKPLWKGADRIQPSSKISLNVHHDHISSVSSKPTLRKTNAAPDASSRLVPPSPLLNSVKKNGSLRRLATRDASSTSSAKQSGRACVSFVWHSGHVGYLPNADAG